MALGPIQPPIPYIITCFISGVNRPRHEADSTTPSNAIINNAYSYNFSTSAYASMAHTGRISPLQDLRVKIVVLKHKKLYTGLLK